MSVFSFSSQAIRYLFLSFYTYVSQIHTILYMVVLQPLGCDLCISYL